MRLDLKDYKERAYKSLSLVGIDPEEYKKELRKAIDLYLSLGFSVIPIRLIHEKLEKEKNEGKKPLISWTPYMKRKPTKEEVEKWFKEFEVFNIAIVCGKVSNVTVLDVDDFSVLSDAIDIETWKIDVPVQKTGKPNGYQIFFKGSYRSVIIWDEPDIRLKGEGGYVLVYPSIHPNGTQYKFLSPITLLERSKEINFEKLVERLKEVLNEKMKEDEKEKKVQQVRLDSVRGKEKGDKSKKPYVKINWDAIPPCVRRALELRRQTVHHHEVNVFIRDFFMTLTRNDEQVLEIFRENSPPHEFREDITRKQIGYWWSKEYKPPLCKNLYIKVPQLEGVCEGCELKGSKKLPIHYYWVKCRKGAIPKPKEKITEPVPEDLKEYVKFEEFRKDQPLLIKRIVEAFKKGQDVVLCAPTGYGKTTVFLTAAKILGVPTAIITVDRGLQNQFKEYGDVVIVKGKDNYTCPIYNYEVSIAPCQHKREFICEYECEWKKVMRKYREAMEKGGIVVLNFGNWYRCMKAKFVIIDEFHETVAKMCHPIAIARVSNDVKENITLTILGIEAELKKLRQKIETLNPKSREYIELARKIKRLIDKREKLAFFLSNIEHVYDYIGQDGKYYVELDIVGALKRLDEIIPARKLWVSATPIMFKQMEIISTDYRVADKTNAPIYYMPITKLTTTRLRMSDNEEEIFRITADFINNMTDWAEEAIGTKKAIIYTANTTTHMKIAKYLKGKVLMHEKGKLEQVIEEFKRGDYRFLCVAGIEAGYDFDEPDINLLFIVKVLQPNPHDPKWVGFRNRFGKERFDEEYDRLVVNSIVQLCGRVARSEDKTSIVFILDEKFEEIYRRRKDWFPQDFKERLVGLEEEEKVDFKEDKKGNKEDV